MCGAFALDFCRGGGQRSWWFWAWHVLSPICLLGSYVAWKYNTTKRCSRSLWHNNVLSLSAKLWITTHQVSYFPLGEGEGEGKKFSPWKGLADAKGSYNGCRPAVVTEVGCNLKQSMLAWWWWWWWSMAEESDAFLGRCVVGVVFRDEGADLLANR